MNFPQAFHSLRALALRRCVLLWFLLAILSAGVAPFIKPQTYELLCSGSMAQSGATKLLVKSGDGEAMPASSPSHHPLDCSLCLMAMQALPTVRPALELPALATLLLFSLRHRGSCTRLRHRCPRAGHPLPDFSSFCNYSGMTPSPSGRGQG